MTDTDYDCLILTRNEERMVNLLKIELLEANYYMEGFKEYLGDELYKLLVERISSRNPGKRIPKSKVCGTPSMIELKHKVWEKYYDWLESCVKDLEADPNRDEGYVRHIKNSLAKDFCIQYTDRWGLVVIDEQINE